MEKLNQISSSAVALHIENIDTDQIIPARFLKAVTREGFGENLFCDWRYNPDGTLNQDFILNNQKYSGSILVTGKNFGCGSSREHAAWALYDYGFRVIISSFFADIFKANALNNGILPIEISEHDLQVIFQKIEINPEANFEVSLEDQLLVVEDLSIKFEIESFKKDCLLNGHDDIDYLINHLGEIEKFEELHNIF